MIFDDAAIFPPGNLPLAEAVAAHHRHRASPRAELVGPLVVTLGDLDGLAGAGPLDVAVVVPDAESAAVAIRRVDELADVRLVALEITGTTVPAVRASIGEPDGITVYLELPRDESRWPLIDAIAGTSYRAKLRTGGVRADLYPDEAELAAALVGLAAADVTFKATAGLHHPFRNTDPGTGFEQHGYLNLLAATDLARRGGTIDEVASVLAEREARRVHVPVGPTLLCSVGTCDVSGPLLAEVS